MKQFFCIFFLWVGSMSIFHAQVIDTAMLYVDFDPEIGSLQKINTPAEVNDTVKERVVMTYEIMPGKPDISFLPSPVSPVKLPADLRQRFYRNFLKVGFGYPVTPLLALAVHNPDNQKFSVGFNAYHYSSWLSPGKTMKNYALAPFSDTRAEIFMTRFFKKQTFYSSIGYNHEYALLYGFHRDSLASRLPVGEDVQHYYDKSYRDSINNAFHHVKLELGLRSNYVLEEKKIKHDTRLNYDMVYNHWHDMENTIGISGYVGYDARFIKISGSQNYRIDYEVQYYNNRWGDTGTEGKHQIDHSMKLELRPVINFTIKEYHLLFGAGIPVVHAMGETHCPVYPVAELQLGLIPGIMSLYGGVNGYANYNSLQNLLYENPFLKPHLDSARFTRAQINVYAGIKGNLVKKLNYHLSAHYAFEKDSPFFILDTSNILHNSFNVMYKNVNVLNATLALNWEVLEQLLLNLTANYWYYNFDKITDSLTETHAWYKPSWEVTFEGQYILKKKMIFSVDCHLQFGRWALSPDANNHYLPVKMAPVLDFGAGFEYLFSPRFSVFARVHNLAFQHYAKYYDFKNAGFNVLAGITYSFGIDQIKKR